MYWYINKIIEGYFVDYETEIDANYWEGQIGNTYEDFLNGKWVLLSPEQGAYHEQHPEADVTEVLNLGKTLAQAKAQMIRLIDEYDNSPAVNSFTINGTITGWFTPEERSNYRNSVDAAKRLGVESLSLFIGEEEFTLPTLKAEEILDRIQLYADRCFIVTKQHKIAVEHLDTIEAVDSYDYTGDYPDNLEFVL